MCGASRGKFADGQKALLASGVWREAKDLQVGDALRLYPRDHLRFGNVVQVKHERANPCAP